VALNTIAAHVAQAEVRIARLLTSTYPASATIDEVYAVVSTKGDQLRDLLAVDGLATPNDRRAIVGAYVQRYNRDNPGTPIIRDGDRYKFADDPRYRHRVVEHPSYIGPRFETVQAPRAGELTVPASILFAALDNAYAALDAQIDVWGPDNGVD
jgi:hypothetical protein